MHHFGVDNIHSICLIICLTKSLNRSQYYFNSIQMKKISLVLIALIALFLNGRAQGDVSKARWKQKEIVIDGNDKEWTKPLNFYDDKSGILFAICNDNKNVYFAFSCSDELKMYKMMTSGWSFELSSKEKNKKFSSTITFPALKTIGSMKRAGSQFEKKSEGNPLVKTYKQQLQSVVTKGFISNQAELKLNNQHQSAQQIDIAVGTDSLRALVYEIAIPLKELMAENQVQLDELITLNIAVNAMDHPSAGRGQAGRGGEMSDGDMSEMGGGHGGMGGGRGGMHEGGGSYGGGGAYDQSGMFERASFKQKFTLTKN